MNIDRQQLKELLQKNRKMIHDSIHCLKNSRLVNNYIRKLGTL